MLVARVSTVTAAATGSAWLQATTGRVERTLVTKRRWTPEHAVLLDSFKHAFVPEASDENMVFYARDNIVLEYVPKLEQLFRWQGWRDDARVNATQ